MRNIIERIVITCSLDETHALPSGDTLELQRYRPSQVDTAVASHSSIGTSAPGDSLTCFISEVVPIHEGEFTCVYRTELRLEGYQPITAVLKTDIHADQPRSKQFIREAEVYEGHLRRYQGGYIPRCYGLFQAPIDDEDIVSVLILEYAGEPIDFSAGMFSRNFIIDAINKLATLHRHGFQHGDLDDRNILNNNGKALFIDLEHVASHKCNLKQSLILDDLQPSLDQFGCTEIYETAFLLGFWQRLCVDFWGCTVYLTSIKPGNAENLVDRIWYKIRNDEERAWAIEDAQRLIEEVESWRAWYGTITDEDRALPPINSARTQWSPSKANTTA